MKKTIALVTLLLFATAGSVFAGEANKAIAAGASISGVKGTGTAQSLGKLSNNVALKVSYNTTTFAAATKHLNGTKEFGSSSGDTKLFAKDLAAGTAAPSDLSASDSSAFTSGWSSL